MSSEQNGMPPSQPAPDVDQRYAQALHRHSLGDYAEAERGYLEILDVQPGHAEANHNLGVLCRQKGREALRYFLAALNADPSTRQYWLSYLGALLEVAYEDIVADQEAVTRRIVEYCGLPWSDDCIAYYRSERDVRTASAMQVRQPLYTSSLGRWKNYRELLTPLFDALGDLAPGSNVG